jgi:hypothetical protein
MTAPPPDAPARPDAAHGGDDPWLAHMLVPGEHAVARARIHWAIFWPAGVVGALALVLFLAFPALPLGWLLAGVAVLMGSVAAFLRGYLRLVITNRRALARCGVILSQNIALALDKLESIEIERMPPGMVLGYWTVVITGVGNRAFAIPYVANAPAIRRAYDTVRYGGQEGQA